MFLTWYTKYFWSSEFCEEQYGSLRCCCEFSLFNIVSMVVAPTYIGLAFAYLTIFISQMIELSILIDNDSTCAIISSQYLLPVYIIYLIIGFIHVILIPMNPRFLNSFIIINIFLICITFIFAIHVSMNYIINVLPPCTETFFYYIAITEIIVRILCIFNHILFILCILTIRGNYIAIN
jgi:hypothetical protein